MRILAITNLYPNPLQPHRGAFNRQQFRALANRHEVRVIAPIAWTDEWKARKRGAPPLPKHRTIPFDGLQVHHPRYWFPPKILRRSYGSFFLQSIGNAFSEMSGEFRPDVILSAWAYPDGWAAVKLGRKLRVPTVVKVHGSDILTLAKTAGREKGTAHAVSHADAVIAVSRDLAEKVTAMGASPHRVSVVYDGIDGVRFRPGPKEEARTLLGLDRDMPMLLFVGNLLPVKGVDILIEACALLHAAGQPFHCCLIGEGPLRESCQEQIRSFNLQDRVRLVGSIAHAELPHWFRAADVFVLPSRSEGVPCVLLEAAACQTPFVATRVGGIPEIAHLNTGKLVDPENAEALAGTITEVLKHDRRATPAYAKTHDDAAREIEAVLDRVLLARSESAVGLAVP